MPLDRRTFLYASLAAATAACEKTLLEKRNAGPSAPGLKYALPGAYPGRVVAVEHSASIVDGRYQPEVVRQIVGRGLTELTHAENPAEAWREFFQPGDIVGIKLNPVGRPHLISAPPVLHAVIEGLEQAGVRRRDIVVYDRYRNEFEEAGFVGWLPDGVRWAAASERYLDAQLDMEGYDRDVYMEMPLVHPACVERFGAEDPHIRRSYVAKFLTREIDKLVNICVLKHHQSAGVTLALKNLSHGLVNNVNRSHVTPTANACGIFIPAVVDLPVIRRKTVLHILDGIQGACHGGPGSAVGKYVWAHKTMYFATDPVALDKTGWQAIDTRRAELGMAPIALLKPDQDSQWLNCQVEHIELAGNMGLGVFDDEKIRLKRVSLG